MSDLTVSPRPGAKGQAMVTDPHVRLTVQDYLDIPDEDENRYELIDGELYMAPAPSWEHQESSGNLYSILRTFVLAARLGRVVYSPIDVFLSGEDVFQPDIIFVSAERLDIIHGDGVHGAPDLVVEILSPGTERIDRTVKSERYARFDVREYWQADPVAKTIAVLRARRCVRADRSVCRRNSSGDTAATRPARGCKRSV